ncbi:radical SAM protein [Prevotella sp. P6B4]|uniref:radical SAM protein n=1 Tax=Prevotella sp. P6B4 TaxID=1410614 RepID=UPI00048D3630|nr:radical SAM protein [Prevotella sp. P6B4]
MKIPLIGICRHRLTTDGQGVTTLVAFHGCPLRCRYCLNEQCLTPDGVWQQMEAQQILNEVMIDDLYFKATNGGVTFGGGEPLLRSDEIVAFCQLKPDDWHIAIETSLNVDLRHLQAVVPYIDHYIIDVKDMNPDIYCRYTSVDNSQVIDNLRWLIAHVDAQKITIRLPHIPDYNTPTDIAQSRTQLESMGFINFDCFDYVMR